MINIKIENKILFTVVQEKITEEDYEKLKSKLKSLFLQFGKIRWYYEMRHFRGWELKVFLEDVKFLFPHTNDFEKIAMVGDKSWEKWMTELMTPFTSAEVKYFGPDRSEEAKQWICE